MKRLRWQKSPGPEEGGYVLAYATMDGYLAYAGRGQSKWMPKVAQKLRDLPQNGAKTVQDVVGKVIKEFRENPDLKYQCPEIIDTYGPVYLSEIANIHDLDVSSGAAVQSSSSGMPNLGSTTTTEYTDCASTHTMPLSYEDRSKLLEKTKRAASKWREIGRELGFSESNLGDIPRTTALHTDVDYYSEMLSQWLDWAPPEPHYIPTLGRFTPALRKVGLERLAYDLEQKGLLA